MADQDQGAALPDIALALIVHLGDQRTGRVEDRQVAGGGFVLDALGDPWALNTVTELGGTSESSSTKRAPLA